MPTPNQKIQNAINGIKLIRETDEYLTPQMIHILFEVAASPGITMQQLMKETNLSLSSISRNIAALSEWHRKSKPGLNFVETVEDPWERRRKIIFLTIPGRNFVERWFALTFPETGLKLDVPTAREWLNRAYRTAR